MFQKPAILVLAAAALAACASTKVQSAGGTLASVTPATARVLPAGSELSVRTNAKLSGKHNHIGDEFSPP